MTSIFLSDVHLRDASSVKSKLVVRFLQEVASRFDRVYILGDLFDIWPGTSSHLLKTFAPVIQALKGLVEDGHQVHYVEGNHDFHLGDYFSKELGICVYPNFHVETLNGKRVYMTHGDLANAKEPSYRILRKILRHPVLQATLRLCPQEWVFKAGLKSSQLSRNYQRKEPKSDAVIRQTYRDGALEILKQGYDMVLMGHTHLPDDYEVVVDGRECRYINTGDWIKHFSYLEFDGSQFYTRVHPVKNL